MHADQDADDRAGQRAARRNPVGGHVPVAGGLASVGLTYAREMGAEAVQVFVANPRGWATPAGNPAQDELFRAQCAAGSVPAYVHAPYLINFASHTGATVEKSVESLRHSLRRARAIGALGWSCTPARPPAGVRAKRRTRRSGSTCCRCWRS